jgi:molybdopterin converting factor subunit 1|tara:strand:- start:183 stop:431 length:249 start_codon:yes stop_codon:yes gene_type:complete
MSTKKIEVKYFALFREQANKSAETIYSNTQTAKELFLELSQKYHFHLKPEQIRVSINEEFKDITSPISSEDSIVFIPPVAGG